jgi:hypothetical protein
MPGFHPRTYSFLLMARSNQKQRIPKDNRNGENSKSRIKCGFYLDSSQFLVRGRSPDPLRSLKPDKGTSSMPSRTLFLVATFETHRLPLPPAPQRLDEENHQSPRSFRTRTLAGRVTPPLLYNVQDQRTRCAAMHPSRR